MRQLAGILSFAFTNAFLAMQYLKKKKTSHLEFKIATSNAMVNYRENEAVILRNLPRREEGEEKEEEDGHNTEEVKPKDGEIPEKVLLLSAERQQSDEIQVTTMLKRTVANKSPSTVLLFEIVLRPRLGMLEKPVGR